MTTDEKKLDALFRDAVKAIDSGDIDELQTLLQSNPELVSARLESPGSWLNKKIGKASFFDRPYLLWFVAEDPVRNGKLPGNIVEITKTILEAARRNNVESLQEQLDYAIQLVAWSWIAKQCGVQIPLIDALADAGASIDGVPANALVNGHIEAAAHAVARGAEVSLSVAMCLERWDDLDRLALNADSGPKQFSLVLAALNGKAEAISQLLPHGVDVNGPSAELYSHGSPLHHAVCSGNIDAVKVLVEAGADLSKLDTAWQGTPLGWAWHYVEEAKDEDEREGRMEVVNYLRSAGARD